MKTLKRKTRSDKLPLTLTQQDSIARRSKEKYIILVLTKKRHYKNIWIKQHILSIITRSQNCLQHIQHKMIILSFSARLWILAL